MNIKVGSQFGHKSESELRRDLKDFPILPREEKPDHRDDIYAKLLHVKHRDEFKTIAKELKVEAKEVEQVYEDMLLIRANIELEERIKLEETELQNGSQD